MEVENELKALSYSVHGWSSYSVNYHPSKIQIDKPKDHTSRWCADCRDPQFVLLKLSGEAIVKSITFGKYERQHVCNMRKFVVYGGVKESDMIELFSGGLENDDKKEAFPLRHELQGQTFPIKFVKIVPLITYGAESNFSIWFVKLTGINNPEYVKPRAKWFKNYREHESIRLCLKHFRKKNYVEAFDALQKASKVQLEDPLLTRLHHALVNSGEFNEAEQIIEKSAQENLFHQHITKQSYKAKWTPIHPIDPNGAIGGAQPGPRGGHQMYIDQEQGIVLLLGGWDGKRELADFWMYNIKSGQWHCMSEDMTVDGGPTARSCHKICLDTKRKHLYLLGRYLDSSARAQIELKSDFYKYDLDAGRWEAVSLDTNTDGGPHLIFDHQMQYDPVTDKIFVFGGRILTSTHDDRTFEPTFSGLFTYHIASKTWTKVRDDSSNSNEANQMRSRSGHSMLLDEVRRLLYVFAGQRGNKEYLTDFFSYNIDTGEVRKVTSTSNNSAFPSPGFTQRATIDVHHNEIFMLSGLSKEDKKAEEIRNSFWVCDMTLCKWDCVYKNENVSQHYWNRMMCVEPRPRYAHQLVYDNEKKVHYLFGGNPGRSTNKERLNDFWMLNLQRPTIDYLVRRSKYMIRKQRFKELITYNPVQALSYLQDEVSQVVDHTNDKERKEFEGLASTLFIGKTPTSSSDEEDNMTEEEDSRRTALSVYKERSQIFDELSLYYPAHMVQPSGKLTDFAIT